MVLKGVIAISQCSNHYWPHRGKQLLDKSICFQTYPVAGVIILLDWEFDAFHADLQDAGGRRVVLDRHPPVGGNLERRRKCSGTPSTFVVRASRSFIVAQKHRDRSQNICLSDSLNVLSRLFYLLHGCAEDIVSLVEWHLHWPQELQSVSVHPLSALLCTARKNRKKKSILKNKKN